MWNGLPNDMKSAENLDMFKNMLKKWGALTVNAAYVNVYTEISIFSFRLQIKFKKYFFFIYDYIVIDLD